MPKRERVQKPKVETKKAEPEVQPEAVEDRDEQLAATDELLDEIDGLLEVNAEEFVKAYVQKGGE